MSYTVIIPSRNTSNLYPCVRRLWEKDPTAGDVTLIWDGTPGAEGMTAGMRVLYGKQPFIYARNCNQGIRAAGTNDVVLLNDDALLVSHRGLASMQLYAETRRDIGLFGCVTRHAGNSNQWPHNIGLRIEPRMVCFICVYIPRRTIDLVGELDERYTGYGYEDDDYCVRVRRAGLKIGICDECYVDHGSLKSTYRPDGPWTQCKTDELLSRNHRMFVEKWGSLNV